MTESKNLINSMESGMNQYFEGLDSQLSSDTHTVRPHTLYWQKWAYHTKDERDDLKTLKLEDTHPIRDVIFNFEKKRIKIEKNFKDLNPPNSRITKWIEKSLFSYPDVDPEIIENIIDTFRSNLKSRSKEHHKNIVIVIILENLFLIAHCKSNIGIVEANEKVFFANELLNSNNVHRAGIIKNNNGFLSFSAYEKTKKWSKGHAEFWGIEPDEISWDQLGSMYLHVSLEHFSLKIQIPIDLDQFRELMRNKKIEPSGSIFLGDGKGTITDVQIFHKLLPFKKFYSDCALYEEKLNYYVREFSHLLHIGEDQKITEYVNNYDKFLYSENINSIIDTREEKEIIVKKHPFFTICFSTTHSPGVRPTQDFIDIIYEGFFANKRLDLYHPGEEFQPSPTSIGAINLYNKIELSRNDLILSDKFISLIQDARSKKICHILEYVFCEFWKSKCSKSIHLLSIFNFIIQNRIINSIEFEFTKDGILETENIVDYKSKDDYNPKLKQFVENTLVPTIKKYHEDGELSRVAIIYGIEDNGEIIPCSRLKSDMVTDIEVKTNQIISNMGIRIVANSIPFKNDNLLLILLIQL